MPPSNEATEAGREENRRVELVASRPELLAGIETDSTVQRRDAGSLVVQASATSRAGILAWTLNLQLPSGHTLLVDGDSTGLPHHDTVDLGPDEETGLSSGARVRAEFSAKDNRGGVTNEHAEVPVVVRERQTIVEEWTRRSAEREVATFAVLGFGFDSPELAERHRRELTAIASRIRPGALVRVTGYSDRLGDESRNIELSGQRAASVAIFLATELERRAVNPVALEQIGAGVDSSRFPNDLPEGRMLSRGVVIVVEQ
jgi:outer membrane protein OmpA-like peptidoglycan-associated protein